MSAAEEKKQLKKTKGHWGRRKRRLQRVAWTLGLIALVVAIAGLLIYRATRPEVRRPGERLEDITESLSQGLPEGAPEPRFTDVTSDAGLGDFATFVGGRSSQLPEDMGPGVAWADFDNDGDDDLFLVGAGGRLTLPPEQWAETLLFENRGNGTFKRSDRFPETRIMGMGAAWGDYDGDGWLDLLVTAYGGLHLFHNEQGRLVPSLAIPNRAGYWAGAAWGDFDNDRDLDLYVCGYVQYVEDVSGTRQVAEQYGTSVPYTLNPASFEPESNLLFQNNGDGIFEDVAVLYGVSNPGGRSLGALWQDFDDDGRIDLYVANDISDNALFLNRGDTFEDVSLNALVADYRGAMGLTSADWNRDGDLDLFVTHWIAQENALYDSRLVDFQRLQQGETGQAPARLSFSDLAAPLGVGQIALHSVGWGTEFADFDADGWLDLVVANGSTLETREEPKTLKPQPDMFLWNRQGEYFHDLAPLNESFSTPHVSRGLAVSDYDLDGDLDIVIADLYGGVRLLRNDMQSGNSLQIRLRSQGPRGEKTGLGEGSSVTASTGELNVRRTMTGASYLSQSTRALHFGLGEATAVDGIEVRWLGGETETFGGLEANSLWELTEGDRQPRRLSTPATLSEVPPDSTKVPAASGAADMTDRERIVAFWEKQRAGMDAFKIEQDIPKAAGFFAEALELNPDHEDSRYYLANCLAVQGQIDEAMMHLEKLMEINPMSHRAYKQWGVMRAMTAESPEDLEAANRALQRSLEINKEETGTNLVLGQIALMRGDYELAKQNFEWNTGTNPRSTGGFYLLGYLAWKRGDDEASAALLEKALGTRGEDWKPEGAVAEGDVTQRMHKEVSPLSLYWEQWDGGLDPDTAFQELDSYLAQDHPWESSSA